MQSYQGLTSFQAQKKLKKYGPNLLPTEKPKSIPILLLDQIKSPLIYILIFAGIITLLLNQYSDSIVIFLAVLINSLLGFYQEYKVDRALLVLKKSLSFKTQVLRDSKLQEIDVQKLVPGDLVILQAGEKIPADGILIEAVDLSVNEAVLTGESLPVKKSALPKPKIEKFLKKEKPKIKNHHQVFSATTISSGRGKFIVNKTGSDTQVGKIAQTLKTTIEQKTPLQTQLAALARILSVVFVILCLLIFSFGVLFGKDLIQMFELAVAIAVSSIPEGLIISLTVILTIGMQKIFRHNALVRKLISAETLGATTVICADKTGTLTLGQVQATKLDTINKELALKAAVLCNNLSSSEEKSLWDYAKKNSFDHQKIDPQKYFENTKRIYEIPFSSERKYMLTINSLKAKKDSKSPAQNYVFTVGAPDVLLSACSKKDQKKWKLKIDHASRAGYRLIAVAVSLFPENIEKITKKPKKNTTLSDFKTFTFLGFFTLEDPIRPEVKKALSQTRSAGIKVKVITGDYLHTAKAVLKKLGFDLKDDQIIEGKQLQSLTDQELASKIDNIVLFARTTPHQKLKIVTALKKKGEVVAMTGDGVNDALALKKADIGIVVAQASDVAKETADMVLLDSNFATIVNAVKIGRVIFENIRKVVVYLLADSFTEVVLVSGSFLLHLPLPLLPVQILWVNLFADSFPNFALAFEKESSDIMKDPPRKKEEPILNQEAKIIVFIIGLITDIILFSVFYYLYSQNHDIVYIRSLIFAALGIDSLLYVFSCKTFRKNIWHTNIFNNRYLNIAVIIGFIMLFATFYFPPFQSLFKAQSLDLFEWSILFVLGALEISLIEIVKWFFLNRPVAKITN